MTQDPIALAKTLDILVDVRSYHAVHPVEVAMTFHYWIAGAVLTVFGSVFFKSDAATFVKTVITKMPKTLASIAGLILIGYCVFQWGLIEHKWAHAQQQERLETAIGDVLSGRIKTSEQLWALHGSAQIFQSGKENVSLIDLEPDTRAWVSDHDTKLALGGLMVSIGLLLFVGTSLSAKGRVDTET